MDSASHHPRPGNLPQSFGYMSRQHFQSQTEQLFSPTSIFSPGACVCVRRRHPLEEVFPGKMTLKGGRPRLRPRPLSLLPKWLSPSRHSLGFIYLFILIFLFVCFWCGPFLKSSLNLLQYCSFYVLVFWPWDMWDPSSRTRDRTCAPCIRRWSRSPWTTRWVLAPAVSSVGHLWAAPQAHSPVWWPCSTLFLTHRRCDFVKSPRGRKWELWEFATGLPSGHIHSGFWTAQGRRSRPPGRLIALWASQRAHFHQDV